MLKALIYVFAIYGLGWFFYYNFRNKLRSLGHRVYISTEQDEVVMAVKVRDAEDNVEAMVRDFVKMGQRLARPHRLVVIDTGSTDQTKEILQRLTYRYPYLTIEYQAESAPSEQSQYGLQSSEPAGIYYHSLEV